MFRTLADVKWIHSGSFEIVSTSFVLAALIKLVHWRIAASLHYLYKCCYRFGFDEALKVCSFFQFSDFPNGIICLLHYAIRSVDENLTNKGRNCKFSNQILSRWLNDMSFSAWFSKNVLARMESFRNLWFDSDLWRKTGRGQSIAAKSKMGIWFSEHSRRHFINTCPLQLISMLNKNF